MALTPGSRLGVYEVAAAIGEGGMGKVYRARDTKLNRDVALKVLPDLFATDGERLARFEREAQVLASLNHPNIAHLYGVEEAGTMRALVMELVSGPTLADRLAAGPIPVGEVITIARQMAEALEAAHEQGIVHRDLKPANVKVRDDGVVKVLDFGLAKALDPIAASGPDLSNSPTFTANATQLGMVLGTAAYMSPEQAKGRTVDRRADVWAFGVVLYEMLAGRTMFSGENVSDTLAQVILKDPDWSALPATTPQSLRTLVSRCLVRDPRNRLRDIGEARIALQEAQSGPAAPTALPDTHAPSRRRERVLAAIAAVSLLTTAGVLLRSTLVSEPAPQPQPVRFDVFPPGLTSASGVRWLELSPDGRSLAFSTAAPSYGIYVRPLDSTTARLVGGTEAASGAPPVFFWSPDSQHIGYFAAQENKLKRVPATGGPVQIICDLPTYEANYTGTWNADGVILFSVATPKGTRLWRVPAAGGQPRVLDDTDSTDPPQAFFPVFLPDGRHYLAMAPNSPTTAEAFVGELGSTERRPLPGVTSSPRYSAGHLFFARAGSLVTQPFDLDTLQLSGEPRVVVDNVADSVGGYSASANGTLAYRAGTLLRDSPLTWFDRTGQQLRSESLTGSLQAPNLSRDGSRVAIERTASGNADIWVIDLARGTNTRLTDDVDDDSRPVFSPDGTRVAFAKRGGIYVKSASGTGTEERLVDGEITDWSPDGKFISFIGGGDLWMVAVDGDRTPTRIVQTKGNDRRGRFSPDGKWIAYESDFSGRLEIYVQRFPPTAERTQVSVDGGSSAYWRSDGKELFFTSSDTTIVSVDVELGSSFRAGTPRKLFDVPGVINNRRFVVTPDGKQILVPVQKAEASPITVVLNWAAELPQ